MQQEIAAAPGFQDVNSDLQLRNRQAVIDIDMDKAGLLGITMDQIRNTFYSAFGARQISTIYEPSNDYEVILEIDKRFQQDPADLSKIYLKSANGQSVPLAAVAKLSPGVGPVTVNHQGQLPLSLIHICRLFLRSSWAISCTAVPSDTPGARLKAMVTEGNCCLLYTSLRLEWLRIHDRRHGRHSRLGRR